MTPQIDFVGGVGAALGECPVWSQADQALYWEDIEGEAIHRFDPSTGETQSRHLPGRPGSFAESQTPGRFMVAIEREMMWLDWATGELTPFARLEDEGSGNRANDGRCDPAGRFIVGTMHPNPDLNQSTGGLYRVDSQGDVEQLESDVGIPNGLVFDAERNLVYWADTFKKAIWVWDYHLETGERRNRRIFYDYSAQSSVPGVPDGGCLDAAGCYWSASVLGWALTRISPDGQVDAQIKLPVKMPTMPAFGGSDMKTLFVTSIPSAEQDAKDGSAPPIPGELLMIDSKYEGLPDFKFGA